MALSVLFNKDRGKPDRTYGYRGTGSLHAGTDSDSCTRQTEGRRHREHEAENSNLDLLLVK